jgi:hypothetical protein
MKRTAAFSSSWVRGLYPRAYHHELLILYVMWFFWKLLICYYFVQIELYTIPKNTIAVGSHIPRSVLSESIDIASSFALRHSVSEEKSFLDSWFDSEISPCSWSGVNLFGTKCCGHRLVLYDTICPVSLIHQGVRVTCLAQLRWMWVYSRCLGKFCSCFST